MVGIVMLLYLYEKYTSFAISSLISRVDLIARISTDTWDSYGVDNFFAVSVAVRSFTIQEEMASEYDDGRAADSVSWTVDIIDVDLWY